MRSGSTTAATLAFLLAVPQAALAAGQEAASLTTHWVGLVALGIFAVAFVLLGSIGAGKTTEWIPEIFGANADVTFIENFFGRTLTVIYFGFFAFLRTYTRFGYEKTKPVPERVTTHA